MFYVQFVIFIICFVPISLIVHECGHIIGARLNKATEIKLTIGTGSIIFHKTWNNMTVSVKRLFIKGIYTSSYRTIHFTHNEKIIIALLGPIFSLLFALLLYLLFTLFAYHDSIQLAYLFNFWLALINLIPFRVGQKQSDGYTIYKMIKKRHKK